MLALISMIQTMFPEHKNEMPALLEKYCSLKDQLITQSYITDQETRVLIPQSLRAEILQSLHSAYQGVSSMNERAKASIYWPGILTDIQKARNMCSGGNRITPSQARTPPIEPCIPTTHFEGIACDYFHYMGTTL